MRFHALPLLLAASFAVASPVQAQTDLGKAISGIAQSLLAQEADRNAYVQAQRLNTARGYRSYLAKFPNGAYRINANRALVKLGASVDPTLPPTQPPPTDGATQTAASIEASLGLGRSQRIQIQQQLTAIGYPTGIADGLWGAKTRTAIGQWQKANKLVITGYVTARQVRLLALQAGPVVAPAPGTPDQPDDVVEERLLGLNFDERREVQRRLTALGYRTFGFDGNFGRNTRLALADWQRDEGLRASGYLTADQFRRLLGQPGQ